MGERDHMTDENIKSNYEKGHFLNKEQKVIKQKIMEDMLDGFFKNAAANSNLFNIQEILDLTFSVLIMLNREILVHTIKSFNLEGHRKQLIKDLHEQIKEQVNNIIKRSMM